ncbi:ROK family protein [Candidatus Saccharibacteria bacterium]|nr:ROK family protein [Candidatus Saccharibacteria bacterium]
MYLSVDIGGTKTLVALFSKRGRILRRRKFKTAQGSRTFINDLTSHLADFKKYKIRSVVVAIPGIVQKNYSVKFGNRNWNKIDIYTPVKNLFECPVYFENDASLGALYEAYRLPGRTVFLTFSTGIGGGVVEHNRILPESSELEPGHKKYRYGGKVLEWEDIASANAIENYYHVDAATDLRKKEVMEDIAKRVYLGLPDVIKKYQPSTVVLGGPLGKIFKLYTPYLPEVEGVRYRRPKRPNESVIYGCYLLARQKERE